MNINLAVRNNLHPRIKVNCRVLISCADNFFLLNPFDMLFLLFISLAMITLRKIQYPLAERKCVCNFVVGINVDFMLMRASYLFHIINSFLLRDWFQLRCDDVRVDSLNSHDPPERFSIQMSENVKQVSCCALFATKCFRRASTPNIWCLYVRDCQLKNAENLLWEVKHIKAV